MTEDKISDAMIEAGGHQLEKWSDGETPGQIAVRIFRAMHAARTEPATPLSDDKLSGLVDELVAAAWQEGGPDAVERLEKAKANVRSTIETLQQQLRVRDEALLNLLIRAGQLVVAADGIESLRADRQATLDQIIESRKALSTTEGSDR